MGNASWSPLLVDSRLTGWEYARKHSEAVTDFFHQIIEESSLDTSLFALVAVGSYGRRELCPYSDIDVLLLHEEEMDPREAAEALWYPLWDRGIKIGYSVVTVKQAAQLAFEEFQWATALLDSRLIFGSESLFFALENTTRNLWSVHKDTLMKKLSDSIEKRKGMYGAVSSQIEPNVKHGRGGLRDIHTMNWARKACPSFTDYIQDLGSDISTVLRARVELHRSVDGPGDTLTFDEQDEIAAVLGAKSSKSFMTELARAGRRIAWFSDEAWTRWSTSERSLRGSESFSFSLPDDEEFENFVCAGEYLRVDSSIDLAESPYSLIKFARLAAELDVVMSRESLMFFKERSSPFPEPWTDEARSDFVALFLTGQPAIETIEDLDHFGLFELILPEWKAVQCRPQRNVLHRFTVDRHLCETAVKAGELAHRVKRPDLLIVGAFLHDIGKGFPGDHTEVGMELIAKIGDRMGFCEEDVSILIDLCRYHLLLADVATRRDLSDPGTIASVASAVENVEFLELLSVLTEADSISTGPSAWGSWKAGLLAQLVARVKDVLEGAEPEDAAMSVFPSSEIQALMDKRCWVFQGDGSSVTVIGVGVDNLFGVIAGVLAIKDFQVLRALSSTQSFFDVEHGHPDFVTACRFTVQVASHDSYSWEDIETLARQACAGKVALGARVALRARAFASRRKRLSAEPPRKEVQFDNETSDLATIVEVHSSAHIGLLYKVMHTFIEMCVEVRSARVQTFGPQRVNSFYLCDKGGYKIYDETLLNEIRLAIIQVLDTSSS